MNRVAPFLCWHALALAVCALCGLALCRPAWAQAPAEPEAQRAVAVADTAPSTGAILTGILGYTAWPGEVRAIQLCVSRSAADAAAILAHVEQARPARPLNARSIEPGQPVPASCDAVYFEAWEPEAQRAALRGLASRPVLTIGRSQEFCTDGGLFCLEPRKPGSRFEVNLDAVARSGLRVNPLVLRLARPRAAAAT